VANGLRAAADWFGPGQPIAPTVTNNDQAQSSGVAGRQYDYPVAVNTNTRPRTSEPITFEQLRGLADNYDLLRLVIETRKDQLEKLAWAIKPKDGKSKPDARCDELNAFFAMPDKEHSWSTWLRMVVEDLLVIDAPALYARKNKAGGLYALEPVDGSTIKRLLDNTGRTPLAPDPAYQQILKGFPAINYTTDELIYCPRNVRTHKPYGFSPVEQVIMTINIAIRRQIDQLGYYTDGNTPNMLFQVPKEWGMDEIKRFQAWWDEVTRGANKHYGRFIPEGANPVEIKQPPLKDIYDEWLARVVCFAFSIEPTPFVSQVNRAVAETSRQQSLEEGLFPLKNWVKSLVDSIIVRFFGYADIEFCWLDEESMTAKQRADVDQIYLVNKVKTPDEVRAELGLDPLTTEQRAEAFPVAMPSVFESSPEKVAKAKKRLRPIDRDRELIGRLNTQLENIMLEFFASQSQNISAQIADLAGLSKADGVDDVLGGLEFDGWASLVDTVAAVLVDAAVSGADEAAAQLAIADDDVLRLMRRRATAWAESRGAEMVGMKYVNGELVPNPNAVWQITDGTREWLRPIVRQAMDEGWSSQELANRVAESPAFGRERAEMIARTEIARADIEGSVIGWDESGLVDQKEWLTAPDCCDVCQAMDGEIAPLNGKFKGGKDVPLHPRCRCSVLPVVD
jgi:SPP1 gp7 family putative phage head morphogenesis protein